MLRPFPVFRIFEIAYKLFSGTIYKSKYYESYECKNTLNIKNSNLIHLDGEPLKINEKIKIQIMPKALKVLSPLKI